MRIPYLEYHPLKSIAPAEFDNYRPLMAKVDYISIREAMPEPGTHPKVLTAGKRRGQVEVGSERWNNLVSKFGDQLCWKPHWTEGGPYGG